MLKVCFGERNFKSFVRFDWFKRRALQTGAGMLCCPVGGGGGMLPSRRAGVDVLRIRRRVAKD